MVVDCFWDSAKDRTGLFEVDMTTVVCFEESVGWGIRTLGTGIPEVFRCEEMAPVELITDVISITSFFKDCEFETEEG